MTCVQQINSYWPVVESAMILVATECTSIEAKRLHVLKDILITHSRNWVVNNICMYTKSYAQTPTKHDLLQMLEIHWKD